MVDGVMPGLESIVARVRFAFPAKVWLPIVKEEFAAVPTPYTYNIPPYPSERVLGVGTFVN